MSQIDRTPTASQELLILSVSAGNGHVRAAQALAAAAGALQPACQATHVDAMAHVAAGFRKVYTDWYIQLVNRAPELWSYLHQKTDETPHSATSQRLRRAIERVSAGDLLREVRKVRPRAIVCTHFLPAELLMREQQKGRLDAPIWLQVTDYDLHNMWLVPGMAGYLAATEEVAFRMRARGLPADRVHVTGIPVMPGFSQPQAPELAREPNVTRLGLGLDPARRVILMASGGAGVGDLPSMVEQVLALQGPGCDFQVIAVAGRNEAAHTALQALAQRMPGRLVAIGFTQEMERLMAAADLVVTKPGGLTISECLALGRPMLLVSPIPGQEEHNAGFLLEEGAAWLAYDAIGLGYKVARLMAMPEKLAQMAAASRALGKPHAARRVLEQVLGR
ncbi:MAG TPA: glycosyltransferase [Ideonella sp.]|uniref:MGDG synthase family glycosyltransferase n=1 Tax=Ideonella sp. TaxID=1929293 RepID=UPI002B7ACB73|nr:glycosyltransferase [Ideonella sp.]HSI50233.1 glycosyltransferase [Ideonella sp.]